VCAEENVQVNASSFAINWDKERETFDNQLIQLYNERSLTGDFTLVEKES